MGINEMVRRRVDYKSAVHTRRIIYAHRIHRHRSGQDHLSLSCVRRTEQGSNPQEVLPCTAAVLYGEAAYVADRLRGLRGIALSRGPVTRARTPGATHSCTVC